MISPTKLIQTRVKTETQRGNCFPTVIACIMGLDDPEKVIQFQEYYDNENVSWWDVLDNWLEDNDLELITIHNHLYNDEFYFVSGRTERETSHICIYQNGELWHDPYPNGKGLVSEVIFQQLKKIK